MPMVSAFDGYVCLDSALAAWEMKTMQRVRRSARGRGHPRRSYPALTGNGSALRAVPGAVLQAQPAPRARYRGLGVFVVLVAAAALASAACRGPQASDGVGGQ